MDFRLSQRIAGPKVALTIVAGSVFLGLPAAADVTKAQCVEADVKAQDARREGRFREAREALHVCSDAVCPPIVRDDCAQRINDLDREQPTVIIDARDGDGHDLRVVHVTVDGRPLTDRLDGLAHEVDPGPHTFTFEAAGQPPVTLDLVLKEEDKGRRVSVTIGGPAATPSPPVTTPGVAPTLDVGPAPAASSDDARHPASALPTIALVAGGAGLAGIALGAIFGIEAIGRASDAKCNGASPKVCANGSALSAAKSDGALSTVFVAAGGALAAAGITLWLVAPRAHVDAGVALGAEGPSAVVRATW